jgi:hypothetical protein
LPETQLVLFGHLFPQVPQFLLSLLVSVHSPPQRMPLHFVVHWPFMQPSPDGHAMPQPPQFWGLVVVSTQALRAVQ